MSEVAQMLGSRAHFEPVFVRCTRAGVTREIDGGSLLGWYESAGA